jgi:hypothetical protein
MMMSFLYSNEENKEVADTIISSEEKVNLITMPFQKFLLIGLLFLGFIHKYVISPDYSK